MLHVVTSLYWLCLQRLWIKRPPGEERLRRKHVHWPGAHVHSQAAAAAAALHLLGDADLGHLHFKLVPHTHRHTVNESTQKHKWGMMRERVGEAGNSFLVTCYMDTIMTEVFFQCGSKCGLSDRISVYWVHLGVRLHLSTYDCITQKKCAQDLSEAPSYHLVHPGPN